jgi:4-amino-4-deoxy-L-arabinose transferase-like glycosyltransferase
MTSRLKRIFALGRYESFIFILAVALRLAFMLIMIGDIGSDHLIDKYPDPIKYVRAGDYIFGGDDAGKIDLYLVGPGYPILLGLCKNLIGPIYWPVILFQIILSGLTCVLIFRLSKLLLENEYISVGAGLLSALSLTSITLANAVTSETLFVFLATITLYLYFKSLMSVRWALAVGAGIAGGLAVLTRSVFMFYPLMLFVFALLFPVINGIVTRKRMILNTVVCCLIIVLISIGWGLRNYRAHETFTISATGLLAAKTYLTAKVLIEGEQQKPERMVVIRDSVFQSALHDFEAGHYRDNRDESIDFIYSTFKRFPDLFIKQYLRIVMYNVTAVSSLQNVLLPSWKGLFETLDNYLHRGYDNPAYFMLSLVGFAILWRKSRRIAVILLLNVLYYAFLSGVTFGQGSRIFYPATVTQSILIVAGIIFLFDLLRALKTQFFIVPRVIPKSRSKS